MIIKAYTLDTLMEEGLHCTTLYYIVLHCTTCTTHIDMNSDSQCLKVANVIRNTHNYYDPLMLSRKSPARHWKHILKTEPRDMIVSKGVRF